MFFIVLTLVDLCKLYMFIITETEIEERFNDTSKAKRSAGDEVCYGKSGVIRIH